MKPKPCCLESINDCSDSWRRQVKEDSEKWEQKIEYEKKKAKHTLLENIINDLKKVQAIIGYKK